MDTSLYPIRKIIITDSLSDTTFIRRVDFGKEASDFLSIPDLGDKKWARRYKEQPAIFDESLNRVIITFLPIDPIAEEIKKQVLLIIPGTLEGDKVSSVIITYEANDRNHYLKKEMLWQFDKSFQVVKSTQLPGQPEKTITTRVVWNDESDQ